MSRRQDMAGTPAAMAGGKVLTVPTIHLNGTKRVSLVGAYSNAMHALDEAEQALRQTVPNGRDYYPQGDDALRSAQAEHWDRMRRLKAIRDEIEALAEALVQYEPNPFPNGEAA